MTAVRIARTNLLITSLNKQEIRTYTSTFMRRSFGFNIGQMIY